MAVSKLCRVPAVDRRPDKLLGGDDEGKCDGDGYTVEPVEAVSVVIVGVVLELANAQHRLE